MILFVTLTLIGTYKYKMISRLNQLNRKQLISIILKLNDQLVPTSMFKYCRSIYISYFYSLGSIQEILNAVESSQSEFQDITSLEMNPSKRTRLEESERNDLIAVESKGHATIESLHSAPNNKSNDMDIDIPNEQVENDFEGENNRPKKKNKANSRQMDWSKYSQRSVALHVVYDGTPYFGFAAQNHKPTRNQADSSNSNQIDNFPTVEKALFDALLKVNLIPSRLESNYNRCGRTDKGVSAFGQVGWGSDHHAPLVEL